jgi:two-component sensor histidine kinase
MAIALKEQRPIRGVEAVLERPDGTRSQFLPYPTPIFDEETGELVGAVNMLIDISEHKQAEKTRELLIRELHHRIKNTLANVQALAQHTLRRSASPIEFVTNFSNRVQALARAHSILTNECWQGIDLKALVHDQLQASSEDERRLTVGGPELRLEPEMALHVAMLLNELQSNAIKHGAFSTPNGRVNISWSVRDWVLHLRWRERGGPLVSLPARRGFGIMLIEQSAKAYGGEAHLSCEAHELIWNVNLVLPRSSRSNEVFMSAYANHDRGQNEREGRDDQMNALAGKRVLVVEDEPLIALEQAASLEDLGMEPVGPAGSIEEALKLVESGSLDAALLDGNLLGHPVDEVAAALTRRGIPFAFITGYGRSSLPQAFQSALMIAKPCTHEVLAKTMQQLLARGDGGAIPLRSKPSH